MAGSIRFRKVGYRQNLNCIKMKSRNIFRIVGLITLLSQITFAQESTIEFSSTTFEAVIVTNKLQETLDFYTQVVGLTKVGEFTVDKDFSKRSGLADGKSFKVTTLKLIDKSESSIIKVISFNNDFESTKGNSLNDGVGVQMLNFKVKSMEPVIERIKKNKVSFLGDTPIYYHKQKQFVLIQDPNGVLIEFME